MTRNQSEETLENSWGEAAPVAYKKPDVKDFFVFFFFDKQVYSVTATYQSSPRIVELSSIQTPGSLPILNLLKVKTLVGVAGVWYPLLYQPASQAQHERE